MHAFYSYNYRPQWNWIYEKIFPIRQCFGVCGALVFVLGVGIFFGGGAALFSNDTEPDAPGIAENDHYSHWPPNPASVILVALSVIIMIFGCVVLSCGIGAVQYHAMAHLSAPVGQHICPHNITSAPRYDVEIATSSRQDLLLTPSYGSTEKMPSTTFQR